MKIARTLLWGLAVVAVLQSIYYYPQLPSVVASHFGGGGEPNGWSSRLVFFAIYFGAIAITLVVFIAVPIWSAKRNKAGINMPNKDYWFHPERREATLEFIKLNFLWLGVIHMLLALIVVQMVIKVNLTAQPILGSGVYWVLGAYFLFLILWLVRFMLRFVRRTDATG